MTFVFRNVYVRYYIFSFGHIVPFFYPCDESSDLIIVYDLYNVLVDVVYQYCIEDSSIYGIQ